MKEQRTGSRIVSRITAHLVWITKYRYPVLKSDIQTRCRTLIIQVCDTEDVVILKGVVVKDHVHMHIEYPTKLSLKRTHETSKRENLETTGNITEEMVQQYLEHHRNPSNQDTGKMILE